VAIWCSDELKSYNDQLFDCEYRADSRDSAYVCICGSREEYKSLTEFLNKCREMSPVYDRKLGKLQCKDQVLIYEEYENLTQYI